MNPGDYLKVSAIMGAIVTVLGWWLKSRLDSSIRHEYDKLLELFRAQQRRSEVLQSERLDALRALSKKLLALRRYCNARTAELGRFSEFEPRTDSLAADENRSLLVHRETIGRAMEERELFLSPNSRKAFERLFDHLELGCNLELWLAGGKQPDKLNATGLYEVVVAGVNDVMTALYSDLQFPVEAAPNGPLQPPPAPGE